MTTTAMTNYTLPRCLLWSEQLTRPTTCYARGCKLWSRERQFYEDERTKNMNQFTGRPYLHRQYPEIGKHYPGTWRVVDTTELDDIVARLTRPTQAHVARAEDIKEHSDHFNFVSNTEKAKDICYKRPPHSASPRLEGNTSRKSLSSTSGLSTSTSLQRFRGSRKWDKTAWAFVKVRGTSPLPRK